ncbi:MAG: glycine cleavage system aminomethyltransferase GcvT [candidate division WOR-3 bacterium]
MLKRTPFYEKHVAAGGRMVPFAGYELPLQFRGIVAEHLHVRKNVGVFDVSHMGRIIVRGHDALAFVSRITTNDPAELEINQAQYSVMCYDHGGIVDDLVIYRREDGFLLVVNGANNEKDTKWLRDHISGDVTIENITEQMAQLAVQGPLAEPALQKISSVPLSPIGFYLAVPCRLAGIDTFLSRTGHTGADGLEIYFSARDAGRLWDALFDAGREFSIEPIGLGARDTLRLEMKMALYGNDIDETTNPLEAGLSWVVKLDKPGGFIGADALKRIDAEGVTRRLVCLLMQDSSIPRPRYSVAANGKTVGYVTSGTMSPSLNQGIALAYVTRDYAKAGTTLTVDIRGRPAPALVVKPPFYKQGSRKQ